MPLSTVVQDIPYDFHNLQISLVTGQGIIGIINGIEDIEYSAKMSRGKLYGSSRTPRTRTDGEVEPDASMTIWRSHFQAVMSFAKQANIPIAKLHMTIAITYSAQGYAPYTDTLYDVLFGEIGNSASRGPDALMVKLPLDPLDIFYDGVNVFGKRL